MSDDLDDIIYIDPCCTVKELKKFLNDFSDSSVVQGLCIEPNFIYLKINTKKVGNNND